MRISWWQKKDDSLPIARMEFVEMADCVVRMTKRENE